MKRPPHHSTVVLKILKKNYAEANCALIHKNSFQLLVSTILSAQCTDKRVNQVTPSLFKKFKNVKDFANADLRSLENSIRSTGFFRQKSKWIQQASKKIVSHFNGQVPKSMDELLTLPGVARKTANVVMGSGFGISSGIVVDTHVKRITKRLGLTKQSDPVKVEKDLVSLVPMKDWIWISHALITHGRQICKAITPLCNSCPLQDHCPSSRKS